MPGLRTKIPHAAGQPGPYEPQLLTVGSRASELQLLNPHIAATEANTPRADAQQLEKPPQSLHSAVRSSPHSPQLEKACMQQQRAHMLQGRLSTAKTKKNTKHPPHHHFTPAFIRFPFSSYTESYHVKERESVCTSMLSILGGYPAEEFQDLWSSILSKQSQISLESVPFPLSP